ncbi:MAG: hypothetical protein ACN6OM_04120 [Alcaligenes nematophilus]|uniref:hypothetical protein n=1 Tax=Alcaligenes nematophilus TaxID=2994643 RepID=UPI003D063B37
MKKVLLALALVVFGVSAVKANSVDGSRDICDFVGDFSKSVMLARQSGVPAQELMAPLKKDDGAKYVDTLKRIVVSAYNVPLFRTEDEKEEAITEFQNTWYLSCIEPHS